ncbi:hypothetical protein [Rhodococcus sp. BUPNP1]|nr:hypothetical protein [Rhodococcus sp. BUPNP1]
MHQSRQRSPPPQFRRHLTQSETEQARRIATLTDVRLLSLLTWSVA